MIDRYQEAVLSGISKIIKKPISDIGLTLDLQNDLQLDSLDIVELIMDIEETLTDNLPADEFDQCKTVQDLINILNKVKQ